MFSRSELILDGPAEWVVSKLGDFLGSILHNKDEIQNLHSHKQW